ncbi:hypothetical protein RB596_004134 [Gaeumannomyces avenae]
MDVSDGTWSQLGRSIAPVSCWTCRRRRLRCDSRLPTCAKCAKAGYRCLGYGPDKPFVWVGLGRRTSKKVVAAMAAAAEAAKADKAAEKASSSSSSSPSSRGSGELVSAKRPSQSQQSWRVSGPATITVAAALPPPELLLCRPTEPMFVGHDAKTRGYIEYYLRRCCAECTIPQTPEEEEKMNPYRSFMALSQGSPLVHNTVVALAAHHLAGSSRPAPKLLEAPMSPGRYDDGDDDQNGVSNTAIFSDALTHKNMAIMNLRTALKSLDHSDAVVAASLLLIWVELLESGTKSWRCHLDGMVALLAARKQHLKNAMAKERREEEQRRQNMQQRQGSPDYHLNGSYGPSPPVNSEAMSSPEQELWTFQNYFEETCLVLHTFGTTLTTNKQDLGEVFGDKQVDRILDRAETRSWTGCPAHLLKVVRLVNKLHGVDAVLDPQPRQAHELINQIDAFDAWAWASSHNTDANWVQKRHHLASAYKGAIEIFTRRALQRHLEAHWSPVATTCEYTDVDEAYCSNSASSDEPTFTDPWSGMPAVAPAAAAAAPSPACFAQQEQRHLVEVAHTVAWHLDHLTPEDAHFKGALWPAFVAGAEARRDDDRNVVRRVFAEMYGLLHCRSVRRAMQVLAKTWASRPVVPPALQIPEEAEADLVDFHYSSPSSNACVDEPSWLEELCSSGEELLLV